MVKRSALIFLLVILGTAFIGSAWAEEQTRPKPERGFVAAMAYPGITIGADDKVRVDLKVINIGLADETVLFEVTAKPEGWSADIKGYGKIISGVFLPFEDSKNLTFSAEPESKPDKLPAGTYDFEVTARTTDGLHEQKTTLKVVVMAKEKVSEAIKLTTSYPVLKGPSDAKFEFSLDVENDSEEDALFNLSAAAPEGWEISFKPAYEQKQISSLRIKAGQSKSVGVEVSPARDAQAGEFPVKVRVSSTGAKSDADLVVLLTGTYEIKAGTPNGLLSAATQTGQGTTVSIYVRNDGSALQKEVSFVSFKPENWKVEFKPEKLTDLKPGELKQVEVVIDPAENALVGDYAIGVSAQGEKSNSDVEFRITVKASSTWGWIGVAIIVLVILGLAFTFRRLGRR